MLFVRTLRNPRNGPEMLSCIVSRGNAYGHTPTSSLTSEALLGESIKEKLALYLQAGSSASTKGQGLILISQAPLRCNRGKNTHRPNVGGLQDHLTYIRVS